jgi:hypothetical protein
MSKIADLLKRVNKNNSQAIGFRKPSAPEVIPAVIILADITSSPLKKVKEIISAGVNGLIIYSDGDSEASITKMSKAAGDIPFGIGLAGDNGTKIADKSNCDFIMAGLKAGPDMLSGEVPGRLLVVSEMIMPGMIKAINDLDVNIDGVVIDYKDSSIDIQFLLNCHVFCDLLNKPLLVRVYQADITDAELKALVTAGIRGLILPEDITVATIKALKKSIASLPANASKTKRYTALIPGISFGQREVEEVEEVEEEE